MNKSITELSNIGSFVQEFCTGAHACCYTCTQVWCPPVPNFTQWKKTSHQIIVNLSPHQWSFSTSALHLRSLTKRRKKKGPLIFAPDVLPRAAMLLSNVPENKSAADLIKRTEGFFFLPLLQQPWKEVLLKLPRLEVTTVAAHRHSLHALSVLDVPCTAEPFLTLRRATLFWFMTLHNR